MKTANVVLDANLVPKVCDFGLSVTSTRLLSRPVAPVGTMRYMSPECLLPSDEPLKIPEAIDVFSFGFMLHELAHTGVAPPPQLAEARRRSGDNMRSDSNGSPNVYQTMARLDSNFKLSAAPHVSDAFAAMMCACCAHAPEKRPTFMALREQLMAVMQGDAAKWACRHAC